jgi:hypothetical protein
VTSAFGTPWQIIFKTAGQARARPTRLVSRNLSQNHIIRQPTVLGARWPRDVAEVQKRVGPARRGIRTAPEVVVVTYSEPGLGPMMFGHVVVAGQDLRIGPGEPLVLVDPADPLT